MSKTARALRVAEEIAQNAAAVLIINMILYPAPPGGRRRDTNFPEEGMSLEQLEQKEAIINKLKCQGCRITKQRLLLLDIILADDCASCKEIYYRASQKDSTIGAATVYRMINLLEDIGAISRKNMYKVNI